MEVLSVTHDGGGTGLDCRDGFYEGFYGGAICNPRPNLIGILWLTVGMDPGVGSESGSGLGLGSGLGFGSGLGIKAHSKCVRGFKIYTDAGPTTGSESGIGPL